MTQLALKNLVKVYPFAKVSGLLGRRKALAQLEEQKNKPYRQALFSYRFPATVSIQTPEEAELQDIDVSPECNI